MSADLEISGGVAELALNWPELGNAIGPEEARALRLPLEAVSLNPEVKVVVLTARGKSFCGGGNLRAITEMTKGGAEVVRSTIYAEFQGLFRALRGCPLPTIAAVDGAAVGLGADLALAADTVFIGEKGWLKQGWINIGLIPATGGIMDIKRHAGADRLWQYLTAERVDSAAAAALGLANPVADAREAALELAARLAALPGKPVRAMKELMRIDDPAAHLDCALAHQVGFLTDPAFAELAEAILARARRG